jgi:hypothetical protein
MIIDILIDQVTTSGFKDGGGVIVPGCLQFTGTDRKDSSQ